ncbi:MULTISPECIES: glycine betaine/L-proline ABC transporter ATP-binding protein [Aerococcus]|uniref:Quaternary amine transport ATP-binding protein n=1 Tax=Aerococcus sanguinicola TaxID=119206 RepID=A0A5N1GJW4_9LACT|nr:MULTISPECIES: glycine betaine/L-proline ABC transporter ATP-binding protein [Aerococcus]KAA9300311.1 glycine betaine/L-proline ABC transporter ATP-binding protein [Aerococcus sanguinicola]MDK6369886.1 glycine betaine/L-proline ABC transporter ATP-binding protein [Aerococcus sp. UMB9870]MDK6678838.1 glycine betaine/L-proline ABC transporter ATP-binding protein [Aerococcus sp. UMB8608]MDK6686844.1 glycine betaine/L-proline ABC transporter ATP-binding protein [Aerococcus sp. UMB8623]MDK6939496
MSSVKIRNLTKIYGSRGQIDRAKKMLKEGKSKEEIVKATGATVGVDNASMDIHEGETFVIMGLSGSGKSTLLRMINRLIEPTSGSVEIDGDDLTKISAEDLREVRRKKVSMVFQNFALFPHMTLQENTEYGLAVQGVDKEERRKVAEKALENAGLLDYKDQYPDQLSGGMQQRVGLARALANDPEILLMDEAFSALDPLIRRDMQDELVDLQERVNKTIIFITHDLDEALRIGDRIALMRNGEVVQVGTGEEILTNPANDYVERFVESVDRSKVITAENAMKRPEFVINMDREGLRVALRRMQEEDISQIMVRDDSQRLRGYIHDGEALAYIRKQTQAGKDLNLEDILHTDVPVIAPDATINETFDALQGASLPVSVVDENGRWLGIINRRMIIDILSSSDYEGGPVDE